jgi:hypothetical protein
MSKLLIIISLNEGRLLYMSCDLEILDLNPHHWYTAAPFKIYIYIVKPLSFCNWIIFYECTCNIIIIICDIPREHWKEVT